MKKKNNLISMLNQNNKISNRIFKQEFITWEYVDHGIKKTTWIRKFKEHHDYDHYSSEIFPYEKS